jgi:hypothetical protein
MKRVSGILRREKAVRPPMPDVAARLHKVFGKKNIADGRMKELLSEDRRAW